MRAWNVAQFVRCLPLHTETETLGSIPSITSQLGTVAHTQEVETGYQKFKVILECVRPSLQINK